MAYSFDNYDNALVIDGWEKGVADSPHAGISDMRNVNIVSVPGEASVNFATAITSSPLITSTITVTGLSSNAISFSGVSGLENGMAIKFTNVGSLSGVSLSTTYWVQSAAGSPTTSCKLYSDFFQTTGVTITGTAGGATFTVFNVGNNGVTTGAPNYFTYDPTNANSYMQDALGQVWSNARTTASGYWCYTGLSGTSDSGGYGLAYFKGYVFAFLTQSIDYFSTSSGLWVYGWKPSTATNHQTGYLHGVGSLTTPHEAFWAPDGTLYYCDGTYISTFFQTLPGTAFDPTSLATYTFAEFQLLPQDTAISLTFIGGQLLVGGLQNIIYSWDRFSPLPNSYILLPEYNVHRMVTVNTNTFIFVGNRGRIYLTNGTNAQLYKKVPDHISGTIEPYFKWGGACSSKNQLYFSLLCTSNSGTAINQYGGVWAIDLDTEAIRLVNQLSYASYAGYARAMLPNFGTNPAGTGLFMGWDDNSSHFGIDTTTSTPYIGSQASIDTDLIPIGTFTRTRDMTNIEYKLTKPMVSGESIVIKTRLVFDTEDTGYTTALTDNVVGNYSNKGDVNFKTAQWLQLQIIINSTASNPSYTRLKQIRILGLTGGPAATSPQLGL